MQFSNASAVEQVVYGMRLADHNRGVNRALIKSQANGAPPYSADEATRNNHEINFNDLTMTRLTHEARQQVYQAFNKPGYFFTAKTDMGAAEKRQERGQIVTRNINRFLKKSIEYHECMRSKFAATVLHGIGPSAWEDDQRWCPIPLDIADVLMPGNTYLTFRNLPFFAIWRGYTANELRNLTRHAKSHPEYNPGWNMPVVERALAWVDEETRKLQSSGWNNYWSPEKMTERYKEDAGIYGSDLAATIDCFDFYFMDNADDHEGWRRRIIFDAEGGSGAWNGPTGYGATRTMPSKNLLKSTDDFLFTSRNRVVADKMSELVHFQFADLSAVSPFRYHAVRGLGFMIYSACHLLNRMNCGFAKAVFENNLMYYRVNSSDDSERALKVELKDQGQIDESIHFLRQDERWQPNPQLIELGLARFSKIISDNSSGFLSNRDLSRDKVEKTKFQVMAEVNAMQTLISAALQQAYRYQTSEYEEIFRRFMQKNSRDPDVRDFRAKCMSQGVPETLLVSNAWDIEPERIMGGGNKTLEMAEAQQLMEWRAAYGPDAQQRILRKATLAIMDDAAEADTLVPTEAPMSQTKFTAITGFGALMVGAKIKRWPQETNILELVQTIIAELGLNIKADVQGGGMVSQDRVKGYANTLAHVDQLIEQIGQDPMQKEMAKGLAQGTGALANEVKGFAQRLAEQQKAQGDDGGGEVAKLKAQIQADLIKAQVKAKNAEESHAQRTAQKQVSHEMKMEQDKQKHELEMQKETQRIQLEADAKDIETAAQIKRDAAQAALDRELAKKEAAEKPKTKPTTE